jgi:hypothetical protein
MGPGRSLSSGRAPRGPVGPGGDKLLLSLHSFPARLWDGGFVIAPAITRESTPSLSVYRRKYLRLTRLRPLLGSSSQCHIAMRISLGCDYGLQRKYPVSDSHDRQQVREPPQGGSIGTLFTYLRGSSGNQPSRSTCCARRSANACGIGRSLCSARLCHLPRLRLQGKDAAPAH